MSAAIDSLEAPAIEAALRALAAPPKVMVVMASDHASHVFYAHSVMRDSAFMRGWNQPLPTVPFLFRRLSHPCAPTFVFLAGASFALAASRRSGAALRGFDRDLALRGMLLIALEMLFITPVWGMQFETRVLCQVLWALGVGMLSMVVLRRLSAANQEKLEQLLYLCSLAEAMNKPTTIKTWQVALMAFYSTIAVLIAVLSLWLVSASH